MPEHAWCQDVSRDASVRAAEDGRTGPLPTLGEAIARPFAEAAERSSTVSKTGEGQSRMRTERVTLEVKHFSMLHADQWGWDVFAQPVLRRGESVRVVEEDREAADRVSREEGYRVLLKELLTARAERDAAIRERDKLQARVAEMQTQVNRDNASIMDLSRQRTALTVQVWGLESQLESVACRAATAETALEAASGAAVSAGDRHVIENAVTYLLRAAVGSEPHALGKSLRFMMTKQVFHAAPAASDGNRPETPVSSTHAASGGGEGEPVAWGVVEYHGGPMIYATPDEEEATQYAGTVVPLYRSPPQPRGWLTEHERDLIAGIADDDEYTEEGQNIAKGLLARSSPPEVVLPRVYCHGGDGEQLVDIKDVRAALAAAGVAVKEAT